MNNIIKYYFKTIAKVKFEQYKDTYESEIEK